MLKHLVEMCMEVCLSTPPREQVYDNVVRLVGNCTKPGGMIE